MNFDVTRRSLVDRLRNWRDQKTWQDFFRTYAKLIYSVARKAGLTEQEAQDVVQETAITVAKRAGGLNYDPAIGSFKAWLLKTTRWRIADQLRKRAPAQRASLPADSRRTATIARVPDPAGCALESAWNTEWQQNLINVALARVKQQADAKQYQIFDCYVLKQWPPHKVATELRVNIAQVYLAKHRISALLKKEIQRLEARGI